MRIYKILKVAFALMLFTLGIQCNAQTPLTVNNTPVTGTCTLGIYGNVIFKVPSEALTGDNIPLNITIPATGVGCTKKVTITSSSNLEFVSSVTPFTGSSTVYNNASIIDPINGQNFNVMYKFPGGVTCDGSLGTLTVKVEINCGGTITACEKSVTIKARAGNYWTISKQFVTGNLTCGESYWRVNLAHNNPNGYGLGAYNISGTVTETTSLPIVSGGSSFPISGVHTFNGTYPVKSITLKNCLPQGTVITNTANYNLTLGGSCGTMTGALTANGGPLQSPSPNISFSKTAYSNGFIFSQGCQGYYYLQVCNNGNVPWTGLTINDNLSIPGINVTSINLNGWTASSSSLSGPVTFTNPTLTLNPGQCAGFYIYYDVTATSGTVTNTATLNYTGGGSSTGGTTSSCPGINCPLIPSSILNTSVTNTFTIKPKQAFPSIVKCNEPNPYSIPIKQVGGKIKFRIQVGNSGSDVLNTTVNDALNGLQNLSIDPATVSYSYYPNQNSNYCGGLTGTPISSTFATWNNNQTNPQFTITGLPGNCNLYKSNIVVIEFEADILPQLSGSKINIATMGPISANANYSIDKTGELKIRKLADVSTIEEGASFNYLITVTNVGSTPFDNIVISDNLPSCVTRNGTVIVKKGSLTVPSTSSSNIIVTVNPSQVINPGESFIITIPVKKGSGSNCCNDGATATAKMIPDGTLINAVTPTDQPACVSSNLCCDIKNFSPSLATVPSRRTGIFELNLNAGSTPIQEIEVSMLDYHVTYSSAECKTLNMGIFGNIISPNTSVGGLNLTYNNTNSLSWILGSPVVLNNKIRLTITKPSILSLSCCSGKIYFCLKVRIKDVNCKVCEKVVCGSFNIKDNFIVLPYDGDIYDRAIIIPELKEGYEKMLLDQQFLKDQIDNKAIESIEYQLKYIETMKREEFLRKLSEKPFDIIGTKSLTEGGPLAVPTGGTTPTPK
jgi:uncharacterized repeat protein (TIGR01451 family)